MILALVCAGLLWPLADLAGVSRLTAAETARVHLVGTIDVPEERGTEGLSGLELSADGTSFTAISDKGWIVTGRLKRQDGSLTGLADISVRRIVVRKTPTPKRMAADAEGLAVGADGKLFVSFEHGARIWTWSAAGDRERDVPPPSQSVHFPSNGGLEALALGPDGALYTLPERMVEYGALPVYRYTGRGAWSRAARLPRSEAFRPVGADFGPDGHFYLLERAFVPPIGFRTRIRRFTPAPDGFKDETVLLDTPAGRHGNLEGISAWRDASGAIRLTMVSDNNGLALQRNQIIEYRVASGGASR